MRVFNQLLVALLLAVGHPARSQGVIPTVGTEFWVGFMENYYDLSTAQLNLYISSYTNTTGTVTMPLLGYSQSFTVLANTVTTVLLPITGMNTGSETVSDRSFLVQTEDTVAVYALNLESLSADAAAIFPTRTLGTEYRVQCYNGLLLSLPSEFLIVATKDGTQVEINPVVATVGGHAAGVPFVVDLDSAQTYQVKAGTATGDLSGSTIRGTGISGKCRPFAVFSGAQCTNIPTGCFACDHVFEQNLPTPGWGKRYFTVPWSGPTSYTYRVMANTDGTLYSVNGATQPMLNAGQYTEVNYTLGAKVIESTVPISVAQYMQGQDCSGGVGDPALLILNAIEQRISNVSFATVVSPNITSQYISVVVETASSGQVVVDGIFMPASSFTPYTADPSFSYATFPLTQGGHSISCPTGLCGYVYGVGTNYETYAYSVGSFSLEPALVVDSVFCGVDSTGMLTLHAPNDVFAPWWAVYTNPDDTVHLGSSYTFTPQGSNVYVVTGSEFLSGCPQEHLYSVEVEEPPVLTITAGSTTVCAYEDVQLNVVASPPGLYIYNWWPAASLNDGSVANPVASPTQSGWFHVSVSSLSGCSVAVDSVYIAVSPGNVLRYDALVDDAQLCLGDTVQLEAQVYQNLVADTLDTTPNAAMWTTITGGTISNACGSIVGNALYFNGPTPLRQAQTVDLNVTAGGLVRFSIKLADGTAPCDNIDAGENILVQYSTNGGGAWTTFFTCYEYQYATWTQLEVAIPVAAQTASTRFRWSQPVFSGAGEDNWSLDNVAIAEESTSGISFAWSPAGDIFNPSAATTGATPSQSGWYRINSTDLGNGCSYADSVYITVGEAFVLDLTPDTAICDIADIQLQAVPSSGTNVGYLWSPNTAISSIYSSAPVVTPTSTTTYTVVATTAEGCSATGTVEITVAAALSINATITDNDICAGDVVNLNAVVSSTANMVFLWEPAANLNDAALQSPSATPLQDTWYEVLANDTASGCFLRDSVFISVTDPGGAFAGNDTTVCTAFGLQLQVVHNIATPTYQWQPAANLIGANTATPTIQFDSTATYVVSVGDGANCATLDTIVVTVVFPQLAFQTDSSLCQGQLMVMDPGFPGAPRVWSTGATTDSIVVGTAGTYTCTLTDVLAACSQDAVYNITVDPLPIVLLGPDTSLCVGEYWILNAGNPASSVLWNTGSTDHSITTNVADLYIASVVDGNACTGVDSILVTFDPLPVIALSDTSVCVSETVVLDAGNPGSSYLWSPTGETTQTIAVNAASGNYSVVVTTATICVDYAHAQLTFISFPVVDLGPDTALCDLESLMLDAGNPAFGVLWSTGATTQQITLTQTANMGVEVFNGYCTTRDTILVTFNPLPYELPAHEIEACFADPPHELLLDAQNEGSSYVWHPSGETTRTITVKNYGQYSVDITTPENCTITESILVNEYCPSQLFMPNSFSPNNDTRNDVFGPDGWNLASTELYIFDRWGGVIRHGVGTDAFWDGTLNGGPSPVGVYAWKLLYRFYLDANKGATGEVQERTGHVTLIR
ncbi:MAG: T9SS type B sorting domain-containing protein [Flavobacteriales bacterium]